MKTKLRRLYYRFAKVVRAHKVFATCLVVLLLFGVVIVRVGMLNSMPVDQAYIDDETITLRPVHFDQKAIEHMEELKESNVHVPGSELPTDRYNPFGE